MSVLDYARNTCGRLMLGAATATSLALALAAGASAKPSIHPFELVPGSFHVSTSTTQAGAHADLTVSFDFAHEEPSGHTYNDGRTTIVELPPGFIGDKNAVPTCTFAQLVGNNGVGETGNPECPVSSQVGTVSFEVDISGATFEQVKVPLYNMEVTSFGVAAQFGFNDAGAVIQVLNASLRPPGSPDGSGITIESPNIERLGEAHNVTVTTWGLPAAHVHDAERGEECYSKHSPVCAGGGQSANYPVKPFLSNPTSCEPHVWHMQADSWERPEEWSSAETEAAPTTECERVPFNPSIEVQPTTNAAESSSGLDVSLLVPQSWENPSGVATAHVKDTVVTLPVGYTINPSAGPGLGVCTEAELQAETASAPTGGGCPAQSKVGAVEVETPVLTEKLQGNVFVAQPGANPFGSLLALYLVVRSPERGILVKLAGQVELDETTGQVTTRFDDDPQLPFSRLKLELFQGATSPLVSPPACGAYSAEAQLTPWSAPASPLHLNALRPAPIETGVGGGPCPAAGAPPFSPQVIAGARNNSAGAYSPFDVRIARNDGEQEITGFSTVMPPGLTGSLTGIPFCPEADIHAARERSTASDGGALEETQPSCPASSQVGRSLVGAGVGSSAVLAQTPGRLYLAGPYHGAPLSLVSITSAKVGPFDLGSVVIRFALKINPITAQVEVDAGGSDAIPHIIKGIVVHVRDIRAYVDRPDFIINPTSCQRSAIGNAVTGAGADPANPADRTSVAVSSPFQAADCANLAFKPDFKASVTGKASKANGVALSVRLAYPNAPQGTQANIHAVKVELPVQLPSRLTTLQKACLAATFAADPAACPPASVVGHAKVITPILAVPLEGPAYFVSHGNEAFPSLIVVLQGYGITIDLVGTTFISKKGITSSTFKATPDVPFSSFELTLPQGPYSALAANTDLCSPTKLVTVKTRVTVRRRGRTTHPLRKVRQRVATSLLIPTEFTAQNGAQLNQSTHITVIGCPKASRPKKKGKKTNKKGRKSGNRKR